MAGIWIRIAYGIGDCFFPRNGPQTIWRFASGPVFCVLHFEGKPRFVLQEVHPNSGIGLVFAGYLGGREAKGFWGFLEKERPDRPIR